MDGEDLSVLLANGGPATVNKIAPFLGTVGGTIAVLLVVAYYSGDTLELQE
jgi:hypothetical protein